MKGQIQAMSSGTYQSGSYTLLATTQAEAEKVQLKAGTIYEQRITMKDPITGAMMGTIQNAILGIQQAFGMIEVTYWNAEGKEIVYQFRVPPEKASSQAIPVLWAVIAVVLIVLAAYVLMWKVYGVDPLGIGPTIDNIIKIVPGIIVTVAGAVITSVLPGKTKIAGIVPIGIGAWLMLSPFIGAQPSPPGPTPGTDKAQMDISVV